MGDLEAWKGRDKSKVKPEEGAAALPVSHHQSLEFSQPSPPSGKQATQMDPYRSQKNGLETILIFFWLVVRAKLQEKLKHQREMDFFNSLNWSSAKMHSSVKQNETKKLLSFPKICS